jgi:hypothetical protein
MRVERPFSEMARLLEDAIENLELRIENTEKIIAVRRKVIWELREYAQARNYEVYLSASNIIDLLSKGETGEAQKQIVKLMRMEAIKGEPSYEDVYKPLGKAKDLLNKKVPAEEVISWIKAVSKIAREAMLLHSIFVNYRESIISKELSSEQSADREELLLKAFTDFAAKQNLAPKECAIWWARVNQAANISLNIGRGKAKAKNPTFQAASKYIDILGFRYLEDLLRNERLITEPLTHTRDFLEGAE